MLKSCVLLFVSCAVLCVADDIRIECHSNISNEEVRCVHKCPAEKTCKTRGIAVKCMEPDEPCKNKCVCKEGYFRNYLGTCITNEQCDKCAGQNEFYACDSACDNECSLLHKQNRTRCPIKSLLCNKKCYCEDGYARDKNGLCIPQEKCVPICDKQNEEYTDCKRTCPPQTCMSMVSRYKCLIDQPCEPGCVCKPGYLREHSDSPCIRICECSLMKNSPECNHTKL